MLLGFKSIVVVGPQHPDSLPKSVLVTLRNMGHEVNPVDEREVLGISYERGLLKKGRISRLTRIRQRLIDELVKAMPKFEMRIYDRLCQMIESHKPDLIITHSNWIPPETIARLKRTTGAKIVCWWPEHPPSWGRQYIFGADYDVLFLKDKFFNELARRIGKKEFYLPEACVPEWHKRVALTEEEKKLYGCDIATAGNMYYYRAKMFEPLVAKYDVKLWGPNIPRWLNSPVRKAYQGRSVTELTKSKAFNAAKIIVNTLQGAVNGVNQRFFEIAGCGGFQVCEYNEAVEEFFRIGEEIVVFHTVSDLMEKVEYYLTHDAERQKIADAGYARAHREHTFEKRLEIMLDIAAKS